MNARVGALRDAEQVLRNGAAEEEEREMWSLRSLCNFELSVVW